MDKPKREAILDLAKYVNERIRVKFTGGREGQQASPLHDLCARSPASDLLARLPVTGVLKGYDQLLNLVLDEVEEILQGGTCSTKDVTSRERAHFSRPSFQSQTVNRQSASSGSWCCVVPLSPC